MFFVFFFFYSFEDSEVLWLELSEELWQEAQTNAGVATEEINGSHLKGHCQWKWGHGCIQGLSQRRETNLFTSEIQRDVRESGKWVGVLEARGSSTHCPGVACLPQKSWRERAPPAVWGPPSRAVLCADGWRVHPLGVVA